MADSPYSPDTSRPWEWYDAERDRLLIHLLGENWEQRLDEAMERKGKDEQKHVQSL